MPDRDCPKLFISHSAMDKTLALMLKDLFASCRSESGASVTIFCSADLQSIEGGKEWFREIMQALRASKACLSLMTPHSIYRPWVLFESGGAYTLAQTNEMRFRMFPVCAYGITASMLPGPFILIQARHLAKKQEVEQLCHEVAAIFGNTPFVAPSGQIENVVKEAARGPRHWENVHPALVGDRLDSSPFSAEHLLSGAQRYFFAAGQNLHHLATSERFRKQLFSWLKGRRGRQANLLICDPEQEDAVATWNVVGDKYSQDLEHSIVTFQGWLESAQSGNLSEALKIRVTKLVTTSVLCIDPKERSGRFVLIPVVVGKPIGEERPHVVLDRPENNRAFDHYWETYREVFKRGRSVAEVCSRKPNQRMQPTSRTARPGSKRRGPGTARD